MSRITPKDVQDVLQEVEISDSSIPPFIAFASALVEGNLEDKGLKDSTLKEIERHLAAHAIVSTGERQVISQEAGPVSQTFANIFSKGFESTTHGQMAMSLDSSGTLADLSDAKKKPSVMAVKEQYGFRHGINQKDR